MSTLFFRARTARAEPWDGVGLGDGFPVVLWDIDLSDRLSAVQSTHPPMSCTMHPIQLSSSSSSSTTHFMALERVRTEARGVSVRDGATALTLTAGASSAARERVRPSIPPVGVVGFVKEGVLIGCHIHACIWRPVLMSQ